MAEVVAVVVPIELIWLTNPRPMHHLADQHWRSPFGEKQKRHAGADDRPLIPNFLQAPRPISVLRRNEKLGAFPVPVILAEKSLAGETPGTFEAIQVVKRSRTQL